MFFFCLSLTNKSVCTNAFCSIFGVTNAVIEASNVAIKSAVDSVRPIWAKLRAVGADPAGGAVAGAVSWAAIATVLTHAIRVAAGAESAGVALL